MKVVDHSLPGFDRNAHTNRRIIQKIQAGLTAYNEAAHPDPTEGPLTLSAQSDGGDVIGGLLGSNAYGWMRIDWVWVDEQHRGKGIGTALLERAEEIAVNRDCHGVHLDTHSFQAPEFYYGLGYEPFGELDNYPDLNKRIWLRKNLVPREM